MSNDKIADAIRMMRRYKRDVDRFEADHLRLSAEAQDAWMASSHARNKLQDASSALWEMLSDEDDD